MRFHNTLTRKIEDFVPLDKVVQLYHCGPTVYNYAHIGNLRSYVFADVLRRTLEYSGLEVKQVINITDIGHLTSDADSGDDKMVKGLKRENLPLTLDGLKQLADKFEAAFKEDLKHLNIETPHHFPRATEYLKDEIELVKILEEKGFGYKLSDGIYFDTLRLKDYGKLGGLTPLDESQARVGIEGKRSSRDFVLWKLSHDDRLGFESPWGKGFPGWHIECSAMSRTLLGQPFDIHTGGIDHIPVHHNNEIAQSEAAFDKPLAHYWLHNEFITVSSEKMAKSEDNFITLSTLIDKNISPLAYRYFLLQSHYRTPTSFTWESLEAAENAYKRLMLIMRLLNQQAPSDPGKVSEKYKQMFTEAIENDLNTPEALAVVWKMSRSAGDDISYADTRATLLDFDRVLGLKLNEYVPEVKEIPKEVMILLDERAEARRSKDFKKSDEIRDKIRRLGFEVNDTHKGQEISRI
ncbi:cysteine--tRNA ligase [Candidatus Parcubacteria bacterium]|nr:cysteine--tRNA ligase [Candidatus Parcubacteria bacterium]